MDDVLVFCGGEVKSLGDGKIGGYLVRYSTPSDPDLEGDFFSKATDLGVDESASLPVYYQHGMDGQLKSRRIGRGVVKYDDVGLWLEAQLELRDEYEKNILKLAEEGKLGWSSGAAGHLVTRESVGKSWHIETWPIAEASLTPTPAEPRNSAVPVKSLLVEPVEPEITGDEHMEIENKTEEVKTEPVDVKAEIKAAVEEALKAFTPANAGGIAAPNVKKITDTGFADDAKKGFLHWAKTGQVNQALIEAKGAWQGQTDNEGGYLVPDDLMDTIVEKRDLQSWVRQVPASRMTTTRDRVLFPTEGTAGTKMVITAEEGSYDENEPVFGQVAVNIHKFTKLVKVSEELLADNGANLEQYLTNTFARAAAKAENYYLTVGSGSGEPQGIVTGATSSSVTTASATAVTAAEMVQTKGALTSPYHVPGETGWLMKFATKNYLQGLTGNPFQFVTTPQGDNDSMLQYPVYLSDDMAGIAASKKPVIIGNFNFYAFAERAGMVVSRNPYLYEATGQVGFFAKVRFGGAVLQSEAFMYLNTHS